MSANTNSLHDADTKLNGKIIVLSAPSGSGKSSIIQKIISDPDLKLQFSISATCRAPRGSESNGKEYYFLTREEFMHRVVADEFVEWEEVYPGTCYGTLKSEVKRVTGKGCNLIMDIDVKGGLNVKKCFGDNVVTIFVLPPSKEELERRLRGRATDSEETILKRLEKADWEMEFAPQYDFSVVNDDLDRASSEVADIIRRKISK